MTNAAPEPRPTRTAPDSAGLVVRSRSPLNAGPPVALLADYQQTPTRLFFVRSHGAVPNVDPVAYRLTIGGLTPFTLVLSLADLKEHFAPATVEATIQCAGNRRAELTAVEPIAGELPWDADAISTATWTGVPVAAVLAAAGLAVVRDTRDVDSLHVCFTGLDEAERHGERFTFATSIPLAKARHPEVVLAYEMNGEPLLASHGFPLRLVVPGYVGARSVKWLSNVTVRCSPSTNYFQQVAYRLFDREVRPENVVWDEGEMLGEFEVNSVICTPRPGEAIAPGEHLVRGYAIGAGGRPIQRVDLSSDGGRTFRPAALLGGPQPWVWRLWELPVRLESGGTELVVRAWDDAGNGQPERVEDVWNFKGYANNAWHRVPVTVADHEVRRRIHDRTGLRATGAPHA